MPPSLCRRVIPERVEDTRWRLRGVRFAAALLLVFAVGCTNADGEPASSTEAPGTTAGLSAEEIIVGVGDLVPPAGDVRTCVVTRLEGEPGLVALGQSVTAGSPAYLRIQSFVDECTSSAGQADPFVELEALRSAEPLTDEQRACVKAAFMALPGDVVDRLLSEGLDAPAGSPAGDAVAAIESDCGVEPRTSAG